MLVLEHLRHAMRRQPGAHLSQPGVDLSRKVGGAIRPFDLVVTSPRTRAAETAVAMGFAVDRTALLLGSLPPGFEEEVAWDAGFARIAGAAQRQGTVASRFARELAELHEGLAREVGSGGRILLVSHGGVVETSAVGCMLEHDFSDWSFACGYCEGVRLYFERGRWRRIEPLRVR